MAKTKLPRQKRGRPRKNVSPKPVNSTSPKSTSNQTGRRRGRPPKIASASISGTITLNQPPPGPLPPKNSTPNVISPFGNKLPKPHAESARWDIAKQLAAQVSNHYAMTESEQYVAFLAALSLAPNSVIVELGVTHGRTAAILTYAAHLTDSHYYGIDNFLTEGSQSSVQSSLKNLNLSRFTIIKGQTHVVSWQKPIDYLLLDAGHDEINVRRDTKRWLPFVKHGGLVLFHAYNPDIDYTDPHFPVKRYADAATSNWEQVIYIPNLLIKLKP